MVRWKSNIVCKTCFDRMKDEYHLLDGNDDIVDTLSRAAFLSQPSLRNLPNGRYRRTAPKNNRGTPNPTFAGIDSGADDDSFTPFLYPIHPGGISRVRTPNPGVNWRLLVLGHDFVETPKPPLKREGIAAGEIIGHRCWRIERGLLRSVYQKDIWLPNTNLEGRELGDWDSRGIHAWKDAGSKEYHDYIRSYLNQEKDLMTQMFFFGRAETNIKPAMATGTVFLWGDVVEHERGWRAEYARVRSLDWLYPDETMMGQEPEVLEGLRKTYNV